jgi:hypothetical protein
MPRACSRLLALPQRPNLIPLNEGSDVVLKSQIGAPQLALWG